MCSRPTAADWRFVESDKSITLNEGLYVLVSGMMLGWMFSLDEIGHRSSGLFPCLAAHAPPEQMTEHTDVCSELPAPTSACTALTTAMFISFRAVALIGILGARGAVFPDWLPAC